MARGKYEYWLTKDGLILLEAWARDGLTDEQIAHNIGISAVTLYDWKKKFPKFTKALKKSKEVADIEVENSLYKRAMGYEYVEETQELRDGELTTTKRITKQVPPDTTAQIFWLKNRKPRQWRDKKDMDISVQPVDKTIEELDEYICKKKQKDT